MITSKILFLTHIYGRASEKILRKDSPHIEKEEDSLELIVKSFNERWFQGWEATPEEQWMKFVQIRADIEAHPDNHSKVADNQDVQNSNLALRKILNEVMGKQRKKELDLYRLFTKDEALNQALFDSLKRMLNLENNGHIGSITGESRY